MSEPLNPNPVPGSPEERQEVEAMLAARGRSLPPGVLDALMAGRAAGSAEERDAAVKQATAALADPLRARVDDLATPGPIMTFYTRRYAIGAAVMSAFIEVYILIAWIGLRNIPWWLGALVTALTVAAGFVFVALWRRLSGSPAQRRHSLLLQLASIAIPVAQLVAIWLTLKYYSHLS